MFIVDDIAKGVFQAASQFVETVTGGLVDPACLIKSALQGPVGDLVVLGAGILTGNPLACGSLIDDLADILEG